MSVNRSLQGLKLQSYSVSTGFVAASDRALSHNRMRCGCGETKKAATQGRSASANYSYEFCLCARSRWERGPARLWALLWENLLCPTQRSDVVLGILPLINTHPHPHPIPLARLTLPTSKPRQLYASALRFCSFIANIMKVK